MNIALADGVVAALVTLLAEMPHPAGGTRVRALEEDLAARFGAEHAVAVSSGTAALHAALAAIAIGPGDEVLVPALSVVMSVAPVVYCGARPVFVDCNPDGTDLDYEDAAAKVTENTKAILPVYLWGRAGDPSRLAGFAAEHDLIVIEDACQAQGTTTVGGRPAGRSGTVGCFSMKDGKILWSGEGGYLLTDNDEIAAHARSFRSHSQPPVPGRPHRLGHNYRLAEPLAVIAHANLTRFDALLAHRRQQAGLLRELLDDTPGIEVLAEPAGQRWNHYSFLATVTLPSPRAFCEHLDRCGVPNSVGTFRLIPADQRPELAAYPATPCPNASNVVDHTLAVVLTDHDDEQRLAAHATTIAREARQWHPTR